MADTWRCAELAEIYARITATDDATVPEPLVVQFQRVPGPAPEARSNPAAEPPAEPAPSSPHNGRSPAEISGPRGSGAAVAHRAQH